MNVHDSYYTWSHSVYFEYMYFTRLWFYLQAKTVPWSKQIERKERKVMRQEIKAKKRKRKMEQLDDDDLDDLAKDARLLKKFKKGKVRCSFQLQMT